MINYYIAKLADLIPLCVLAIRLDRKGAPHSRVNVDMVTAAYSLQAKAKLKQQTLGGFKFRSEHLRDGFTC